MPNDEANEMWKIWRESQTKYDYYVIGIAVALLTYFSASTSSDSNLISTWVNLIASLSLLVSITTGLFLLDTKNLVLTKNYKMLKADNEVARGYSVLESPGIVIDTDTGKPVNKEVVREVIGVATNYLKEYESGKKKDNCRMKWLRITRDTSLVGAFLIIFTGKLLNITGVEWIIKLMV